jgi:hypothetical protein
MKPRIDNAQLANEYRAGASTLKLGRKYQRSHVSILYRLMRHGVERRNQGAPQGNQNAKGGNA